MKNILVTGANGRSHIRSTDTYLLMWQNLISAMKRLSWIL